MRLTGNERAVLRLVAAGAFSAPDIAKHGGPDEETAASALGMLERKGLVQRRVLRDGEGVARHTAHILTSVGQRVIRVA
jgi:hypothetical protein